MKKIALLFLLFCNSIYGTYPYSDNFEINFEQILNQIVTIVGSTKISSDQYYSLTYSEFEKLREMIADLVLHVHNNNSQLATLMMVINKLQNSIVDKFPADSIKGYDQLKRQNQHHVRCITAMFTCALADALIYTFGDQIESDFQQESISFKEEYYKAAHEDNEKHKASTFIKLTSESRVVDNESTLALSAFNVAFMKAELGDSGGNYEYRCYLYNVYGDGWDEARVTARFLLNRVVLAIKAARNQAEIDDILSKKISTLILGLDSWEEGGFEPVFDAMHGMLYKRFWGKKSEDDPHSYYRFQEQIRNSIDVYFGSLSIIFKCAFYSDKPAFYAWYTRRASSSASQLERLTYDTSKRHKNLYARISCVLKKTFEQLKDANFKTDNEVFSEILENYEEHIEKLGTEIPRLYRIDTTMHALSAGSVLAMVGAVLSCTLNKR